MSKGIMRNAEYWKSATYYNAV